MYFSDIFHTFLAPFGPFRIIFWQSQKANKFGKYAIFWPIILKNGIKAYFLRQNSGNKNLEIRAWAIFADFQEVWRFLSPLLECVKVKKLQWISQKMAVDVASKIAPHVTLQSEKWCPVIYNHESETFKDEKCKSKTFHPCNKFRKKSTRNPQNQGQLFHNCVASEKRIYWSKVD